MDGTNHSRGSTIQSLSPDKREGLEHELRPEALASIAREENGEASTNTMPQARAIPTGVAILCAGSREARVKADHRFHFTASYLDGAFTDEEVAFLGAESTFGRSSRRDFWVEEYLSSDSQHASEAQPKHVLNNQVKATLAWKLSDENLRALRRLRILIVHGAKDLVVRPSSARQFHRVLEGRAGGSCCGRGVAAAVAPAPRAKLLMLEDAAHMTIFSHPTQIAEAVDELWGGALRYEEEL